MGRFDEWFSEERKSSIKKGLAPVLKILRNRRFNFVLKWVLVIAVFATIYNQVFNKENISELVEEFQGQFTWSNSPWIIVAFLLMPFNWMMETLKWKLLVRRIEKVPFFKAFKGVFLGVALSIFTPNRIGEYGGRILVVKPENNLKTIVATLVSSFSQMLTLLSLGIVGFVFFTHFFLKEEVFVVLGIGLLGLIVIFLMLLCYFNVRLAIPVFKRIPYMRRFVKDMEVLDEYSSSELWSSLGYSVLRYLIYSIQYYLILRFFGIHVDFLTGLSGISTIFLVQTSIPLPTVLDLAVRSEVALYIWSTFSDNEISIFASTFGLWFMNIIIPALFGMIFIFTVNIGKTLGYAKEEKEKG